jgi:hypothetical protein
MVGRRGGGVVGEGGGVGMGNGGRAGQGMVREEEVGVDQGR